MCLGGRDTCLVWLAFAVPVVRAVLDMAELTKHHPSSALYGHVCSKGNQPDAICGGSPPCHFKRQPHPRRGLLFCWKQLCPPTPPTHTHTPCCDPRMRHQRLQKIGCDATWLVIWSKLVLDTIKSMPVAAKLSSFFLVRTSTDTRQRQKVYGLKSSGACSRPAGK